MNYSSVSVLLKTRKFLFILLCVFWFQNHLAQTQRALDENFKERYAGEKYNYEGTGVEGRTASGSGKYEEYKDQKTKIEEENNSNQLTGNTGNFNFLNWLFILALVLAVVYLVYILLNEGGTGLFNTKKNTSIKGHEEITIDTIEQTDIDALITLAERAGDYRLAIRYYHMLVLKNLSLKRFITLEEDKTNEEYGEEIKQQPFSSTFKFTSYLYDYIWYGEFPINKLQYKKAKSNFMELIQKVA